MCKTVCVTFVLVLALACMANAGTLVGWGDFTVGDQNALIPLDAWAFSSNGSHINPLGFPVPSAVLPIGLYPQTLIDTLTVQELRNYLSSQGAPDDTFGLLWKTDNSNANLLGLVVKIGDSVAATADFIQDGPLNLPAYSTSSFFTNVDLAGYGANDSIAILYVGGGYCTKEVRFAATPEPVSMALLGTGFFGMIALRLKRKR